MTELAALTEDTTPTTTDIIYMADSAGTVDAKVQLGNLGPALGGAWTAYTPAWTSTGTAPAIGNGTLTGRYFQLGKLVVFSWEFVAGSTSTFGTGDYRFSLPVTARAHSVKHGLLSNAHMENAGVAGYGSLVVRYVSTTTFELTIHDAATSGALSAVVGATTPFTWGNTDFVHGYCVYEAA